VILPALDEEVLEAPRDAGGDVDEFPLDVSLIGGGLFPRAACQRQQHGKQRHIPVSNPGSGTGMRQGFLRDGQQDPKSIIAD